MNAISDTTDSQTNARSELTPFRFDAALGSLNKKDLIRLLTAMGEPPKTTKDRERELLATRLSRYVEKITIVVYWDSRTQKDI